MSRAYMHPASFTPPLVFGGHEFIPRHAIATCWGCGATVPIWAVHEGLWMAFTARWCPNKIAALPRAKQRTKRRRRHVPAQMPGQLSIFDVLGEQA